MNFQTDNVDWTNNLEEFLKMLGEHSLHVYLFFIKIVKGISVVKQCLLTYRLLFFLLFVVV